MESQHLDAILFHEVLRDYLKNANVEVVEVKTEFASKKGDNYLSEIHRVCVKYTKISNNASKNKEESVSFIAKLMSPNNAKLDLKIVREMFNTELKTFADVLPRIEKLVGFPLAPQVFSGRTNTNFIVMEDLARRGFTVQDRRKGLSLVHTLLVIKKMALFHAGSVALAEEKPELVKSFNSGNIKETYPDAFFHFLKTSIQKLCEGLEKLNEDGYKQIVSKLSKIKKVLKCQLLESYKYDPEEFCVLNHGDCWMGNLLFKHNEKGEPIDSLFVDFQMPVYTSPAIDLQHFLTMCPEIEIKYEIDDYLLEKYLEILESTMKKIGCITRTPTLEQLKKAIYKRRIYTTLTGLIYYPRSIADNEDIETLDQILENGDTNLNIFKNPDTVKAIRKIIKIVDNRGYLD